MEINREFISDNNTYSSNSQKYIIVHETDNEDEGAGARRHAQAQAAGNLRTSVHFYCGSDGKYQAAEITKGTYSIGTEYGGNHSVRDANNRNSINIEICVNADGDYNASRANAIDLVKYLMQTTGISADRVIRHYDAKGKHCPRRMMDTPALWEDFKAQISAGCTSATETIQSAVQTVTGKSEEEIYKMKTLKENVEGNDVTIFESIMRKMGYYTGSIDTHFGPKCVAACNDFQKKYTECGTNGRPDGSFGPKCWAKALSLLK